MEPKQQVERLIAIAHPPLLGGAPSHALQVVNSKDVRHHATAMFWVCEGGGGDKLLSCSHQCTKQRSGLWPSRRENGQLMHQAWHYGSSRISQELLSTVPHDLDAKHLHELRRSSSSLFQRRRSVPSLLAVCALGQASTSRMQKRGNDSNRQAHLSAALCSLLNFPSSSRSQKERGHGLLSACSVAPRVLLRVHALKPHVVPGCRLAHGIVSMQAAADSCDTVTWVS